MATFMDVHSGFVGVSAQQLEEAHGRDLASRPTRACTTSAPGSIPRPARSSAWRQAHRKEAVMRVHERAGHPTPEVYEVSIEVA